MRWKQATFLVVEDNDLDVEKIERGFARLKIPNPVIRARDGIDAFDHLEGRNGCEPVSRPLIILLDLNMPRMNGFEFLEKLRCERQYDNVPVFVLTTSDRGRDIEAAHQKKICGYIVKPLDRNLLLEALSSLDLFWSLCGQPEEKEQAS